MNKINNKILSIEELIEWRLAKRRQGETVALTNGCFDILHRGHFEYLNASAQTADNLVVAINSDHSVRELKGPTRPINSEADRAYAMASLSAVSCVFVFEGPRLDREIELLRPDVYTKASDYSLETLNALERESLLKVEAKIVFIGFKDGFSTTNLINSINSTNQ